MTRLNSLRRSQHRRQLGQDLQKPRALAAIAVFALGVVLQGIWSQPAFATSAGPNSPTAAASVVNGTSTTWTSPTSVLAQDNTYANVTLASATQSYYLEATGYGFSIPTTSTTVNGVVVTVYKYSPTVSDQTMQDQTVSLIVGGAITGSNYATTATWPTANTATSYGTGTTDMWGTTLTPAQVNASNFGVAFAASNVHTSGKSNSATAYVDYISVTVYYTVNSVFTQASYGLFANQDASSSTSPINVGSALAAQNTAATTPGDGQPFRLRLDIGVATADAVASGQNFKLQYAARGTDNLCDTGFSGETYADVTDTSTVQYYDNPIAVNGESLATNANDPTDGTNTTANGGVITQAYQEKGTTTFTNPSVIPVGKDGMWDFALTTYHTMPGQHYCLRVVSSSGSPLAAYSAIPEIILPAATFSQGSSRWYYNKTGGGTPSLSFAAATSYTTGTTPDFVASADFNGDGYTDIAVANRGSNTVSIFLNNGSGSFTLAPGSPATGSTAQSITAYDFNGDGAPDLAVSNYGSNTVSIFINKNDGTGSFNAGVTYATGTGPCEVTTGDFNKDGKIDLAIAYYGSPSVQGGVSILLGNGDGTFGAATNYQSDTVSNNAAFSVTVADLNGDGAPDVVVANRGNSNLAIFLNKNDGTGALGTYTQITTGTNPYSVTAGDLNGDGKIDLVTANYGAANIGVFLGNGDGTFAAQVTYPAGTNPYSVRVADFNGDNIPDVVVSNYSSNNVGVFLGNGDGTFGTQTTYAVGTNPAFTGVGDYNGDGKPDLAAANYVGNTLSVLLNTSVWPIDVGSPISSLNSAAQITLLGVPYRLRLLVRVDSSGLATSAQSFKLQYAAQSGGSCAVTPAANYADVSTNTAVQFYTNAGMTAGTVIGSNANDPTDGTRPLARQSYQDSNPFTNGQSIVYAGQDGMWDFSLAMPVGTVPGTDICLRAVTSAGAALSSYPYLAEITYGPTVSQLMRNEKWFNRSGAFAGYFLSKY